MARSLVLRPAPDSDHRSRSGYQRVGFVVGLLGLALAVVVLVNSIAAGRLVDGTAAERLLAWGFGLNSAALATLKVGIAVILMGILVRLWLRVESVKAALPALKARSEGAGPVTEGDLDTPFGPAAISVRASGPLFVHGMARTMWAPMLAMGAMAVAAGLVVSLLQTGRVGVDAAAARSLSAWVQGLQFLGEGMVLSGIAFLLGTILYALRAGGGEVQEAVGVAVKTLKMPRAAKLFVGLMMLGLMVEVFQFVAYLVVATLEDPVTIAVAFAWLGPTREVGLGLLLSSIVLALAAIAKVLGFQFWRIGQIVSTGR